MATEDTVPAWRYAVSKHAAWLVADLNAAGNELALTSQPDIRPIMFSLGTDASVLMNDGVPSHVDAGRYQLDLQIMMELSSCSQLATCAGTQPSPAVLGVFRTYANKVLQQISTAYTS